MIVDDFDACNAFCHARIVRNPLECYALPVSLTNPAYRNSLFVFGNVLFSVTYKLKIRRTIQYLGLDVKPACSFAKSKNAREVKRKSWDEGEKIKGVLDQGQTREKYVPLLPRHKYPTGD